MDDATIRVLLSRFIKQSLNDARAEALDDDAFTDALASAAWNSVIYLLRQSLVNQERVCLEQVGEFIKDVGEWRFHPAASLAEADAFKLPAEKGRARLAQRALFHLEQGLELARTVSADVPIPRPKDAEELMVLASADETQRTFATDIKSFALDLYHMSNNLRSEEMFDVRLEKNTRAGALRMGERVGEIKERVTGFQGSIVAGAVEPATEAVETPNDFIEFKE